MKRLFCLLAVLACSSALCALPPLKFNLITTNTSPEITNIVLGIAQPMTNDMATITYVDAAVGTNITLNSSNGIRITLTDPSNAWIEVYGNLANGTNLPYSSITGHRYGSMACATGTVTVATSSSTNLFNSWAYTARSGDVGIETNASFVLTNARPNGVFVGFGSAIRGSAGNVVTVHVYTNHVLCSILRLEATTAAGAPFETGAKEFLTPALPANCRVTVYVGNNSAANTEIQNAWFNVKEAN